MHSGHGIAAPPYTGDRADAVLEVSLFHRVANDEAVHPHLTVSPEILESYLHSRKAWDRATWTDVFEGEWKSPGFLLTFDDGYQGFREFVLPLLERYRARAVIFVTTAFAEGTLEPLQAIAARMLSRYEKGAHRRKKAGKGRIPDSLDKRWRESLNRSLSIGSLDRRRAVLEALSSELGVPVPQHRSDLYMSWEELRTLRLHPLITIGAHTRSHPRLTRVWPRQLYRELAGARKAIKEELGEAPELLAYPHGSHNWVVRWGARMAGYSAAFTTYPAWCPRGSVSDRFAVPRQPIEHLSESQTTGGEGGLPETRP